MRTRIFQLALVTLLIALAMSRPALAFGKNKINYEVFDWKVYHAPHFDVYYYPEEEAFVQQMVQFAESAYLQLSKELDHEVKVRIPLIFFKTHGEFEQTNIILSFIPEAVGAFAEPIENRMVLPIDMPPDELYALTVHELTHIFWYSILFDGQLRRSFRANPPLWLSEGLAEYMSTRDSSLDDMVIRDAVVNNIVPPITKVNSLSFLTYRFGEAAFDFISEEWGPEGIRNLLFEYRKVLLTNNLEKAIKESFGIDGEEFDRLFQRYLRKRYLPLLLEKMEPQDYGREIGMQRPDTFTFSPSLSPTGELMAVLSTRWDDVDILIVNSRDGSIVKNLTKGFSSDYEFISTAIFKGQNDLSWSPTGDNVAFFARKEDKRILFIINAITGKTERRIVLPFDQMASPSFSPDGKEILFSGNQRGVVDIFRYNLETGDLYNVTQDEFFDVNPRWSTDGKSVVYNRRINEYEKIFLVDGSDPQLKTQLTFGEHRDLQPSFSRDGSEIYFTSDANKDKIFNIYTLDLESGEINQWTDVLGGNFTPMELGVEDATRTVAVTTYARGRYRLFRMAFDEPVDTIRPEDQDYEPQEIVPFEPPLKLTLDDSEKGSYDKLKWHFEGNPSVLVGVADDGTVLSNAALSFADLFGDHRIFVNFSSVSTFSNIDVSYVNLRRRWDWWVEGLDYRTFYYVYDSTGGGQQRKSQSLTGVLGGLIYPFNKFHRISFSLGAYQRDIEYPLVQPDGTLDFEGVGGFFPMVSMMFNGDTVRYKPDVGPWHGRRYQLTVQTAPTSTGDLGSFTNYLIDWRNYQKMTRNSTFAVRWWAGISNGEVQQTDVGDITSATIFSIGGFNQIRGYDYLEFFGDRATFLNMELRFPIVDAVVFHGGFAFPAIQGVLFFDVGSAWFSGRQVYDPNLVSVSSFGGLRPFDFWGTREVWQLDESGAAVQVKGERTGLVDGRASYGFGFNFYFGPLQLNWSFAHQLPYLETTPCPPGAGTEYCFFEIDKSGFTSSFYIGTQW
ncbi:MAG: hypothetical protein PVF68_01210 [Acidobacteriota bacterium]|jgi:WD40 repeat protein